MKQPLQINVIIAQLIVKTIAAAKTNTQHITTVHTFCLIKGVT